MCFTIEEAEKLAQAEQAMRDAEDTLHEASKRVASEQESASEKSAEQRHLETLAF